MISSQEEDEERRFDSVRYASAVFVTVACNAVLFAIVFLLVYVLATLPR